MKKCLIIGFKLLFLAISLQSCMGNGMTSSQEDFVKFIESNPVKPSKKELDFKAHLEQQGYTDILFIIPFKGYNAYGTSTYHLEMKCPFKLTELNKDSVKNVRQNIAIELYSNVIEDSTIFDCIKFDVVFNVKEKQIIKWKSILAKPFHKHDLENHIGFKVIEKKDLYERINVPIKRDSNKILS